MLIFVFFFRFIPIFFHYACLNTIDASTFSKSKIILTGSSQMYRSKTKSDVEIVRGNKSKTRNETKTVQSNESESDTSGSQINDFSNMSTYRMPVKARHGKAKFHSSISKPMQFPVSLKILRFIGVFRTDLSTRSNTDNSSIGGRLDTPRHVTNDTRFRSHLNKSP